MDEAADIEAISVANEAYYRAFEAGDLDAMSGLWERSPRAACTHPGWATLRGWGPIAASFAALFQGGSSLQFVLTQRHPVVVGDAGWVSVDENLLGDQGGVTVATLNLFVRVAGGWRLVNHHGSVVHGGPDLDRAAPGPG